MPFPAATVESLQRRQFLAASPVGVWDPGVDYDGSDWKGSVRINDAIYYPVGQYAGVPQGIYRNDGASTSLYCAGRFDELAATSIGLVARSVIDVNGSTSLATFHVTQGSATQITPDDLVVGASQFNPDYTAFGDDFLFNAHDRNGYGVFLFDTGTGAPIRLADGWNESGFTIAGKRAFFLVSTASGPRFYATDGTVQGTLPIDGSFMPHTNTFYAAALDERLIVRGYDVESSAVIEGFYVIDPGSTTPRLILQTGWTNTIYMPYSIACVNGRVVFNASVDGTMALWSTDGTAAGTVKIWQDEDPYPAQAADLTVAGNRLYFVGPQWTNRRVGLYVSDGTVAGTRPVEGTGATSVGFIYAAQPNRVIYSAWDPSTLPRGELYSIDPRDPRSRHLLENRVEINNSLTNGELLKGRLVFTGYHEADGYRYYTLRLPPAFNPHLDKGRRAAAWRDPETALILQRVTTRA